MSQAAGTAATTAATARDASAALPTAGTVRPAPADDGEKPFGALEKRQRTDGDTCGTTTTAAVGHPASPAVTTAAAAAVLAAKVGAAAGSVAASISPVTAAAATFLASTSASASTITNASSDIAVGYVPPTSSFSAAPSVTYTTSKPFGDSTLDGGALQAEPPTLFQMPPSSSASNIHQQMGVGISQPPVYPYATTGPSPFAGTLPITGAGAAMTTLQSTSATAAGVGAGAQYGSVGAAPWNMNFTAAPAGTYYTSAAAGGGSMAYDAAAADAAGMYSSNPNPYHSADGGGSTSLNASPPTLSAAGTGATLNPGHDWMTNVASMASKRGSGGRAVLSDQEGNAYAFPQEIPSGALTATYKPYHKVVESSNQPPTIWGYPGPATTPASYLQREVVELPSKFRPPQVTVAGDNDAWTYSTGTGAVYPTGAPQHLLSQTEEAAGMPAGTLAKNKSGNGAKHTVRAKDAHRRAEQRRRGEQSIEQGKLKSCLGLQQTTSLADTLQAASNTVAQLSETERLLMAELEKQRERRAQLESQQEVQMVRTVMLQKQLREEVKKGDESKFVGKVDDAKSEMTVALLAMGKGFGSADAGSYGAAADGDGSGSVGVTILA